MVSIERTAIEVIGAQEPRSGAGRGAEVRQRGQRRSGGRVRRQCDAMSCVSCTRRPREFQCASRLISRHYSGDICVIRV